MSFKYLGIPISPKALPLRWKPIVHKIIVKFSNWETQWLNPVGRLTFLKVVMFSLFIFQFYASLGPIGIINTIAQELRKLLWKGGKKIQKDTI